MLRIKVLLLTTFSILIHADGLTDYLALKQEHNVIEAQANVDYRAEKVVIKKAKIAYMLKNIFSNSELKQYTTVEKATVHRVVEEMCYIDAAANQIGNNANRPADEQDAHAVSLFIRLRQHNSDEESASELAYVKHLQQLDEQKIRQEYHAKVKREKQNQRMSFGILAGLSLALANAPFVHRKASLSGDNVVAWAAGITATAFCLWSVYKTPEKITKLNTECEQKIIDSPLYAHLKSLTE